MINPWEKGTELMKKDRFEEYFLKYKNLIIRIAMDKTGDYNVAQEICQQVFVSFYMKIDYVSEEMVKAWLIKCTKNKIIDHYRRTSREREIFMETSESELGNVAIDGGVEAAEDRLDNLDLMGKVLRAVRAVNEQWFEVLFMSCVEELSYTEMARMLEITENVLRARLYRARMFIREKFGDDYQDQ